MKTYVKDPQAILDYSFDWSPWLPAPDVIIDSLWIAESGITIEPGSETFTDTITRLFLSGGTHGNTYDVTNRITTTEGRVDERTIQIKVRNR